MEAIIYPFALTINRDFGSDQFLVVQKSLKSVDICSLTMRQEESKGAEHEILKFPNLIFLVDTILLTYSSPMQIPQLYLQLQKQLRQWIEPKDQRHLGASHFGVKYKHSCL